MKHFSSILKDCGISLLLLLLSFVFSLIFQNIFDVREHITALFVFAVFLISLLTEGYVYGISAAILGTLAVNYAFTFPYFVINFTLPGNLISGVIMVVIAVLTSTLTTQRQRHAEVKAESERERMRANLLRAVSHDLRTPLTTIYGSSAALLENRGLLSETQELNMIQSIKEDAEWLVRMVENLLSVTKLDSGRVKIIKTPTLLEELIDSAVAKFHSRYPGREIDLALPDEMIVIPMDAILIEQVLLNLLQNAVQHAAGMTKLTLRVFTAPGQATFEVTDNGCGLPAELLKNGFQNYHSADTQPADRQKKNAGVGLSVCATIIKAHGSELRGENLPGGGARLSFTLNKEDGEIEQ